MLAVEDISTLGVYANYAVDWQTEGGCQVGDKAEQPGKICISTQVAGFLGVFGSQLSIACMTLISAEIWYNTK